MKAEAPYVAGAVQHACDDGLGWGYAEKDIVVAVHDETEAAAQVMARGTAVTQLGCTFQMTAEVREISLGGRFPAHTPNRRSLTTRPLDTLRGHLY